MKPQLTIMDPKGLHNATEASRERIIRGGSWKKQRVIVVIPAGASIPAKVALSHWNLMFPPNQGVVRILAQGMEVGEAYSNAIDAILAHPEMSQWEYVLTVEHDNVVPPDGALRLIEDMEAHPEFACIGGLYWTKGEGGVPQIWGDPHDPVMNFRPQVPQPNTIQACVGTGMGFNLFRLSMFKDPKLRRPWFKTIAGASGCATQDLYAWQDFRMHGYKCAIDTRVTVGHFDSTTEICW